MCDGLFDTPEVDTTSAVSTETEETSSSDAALESKRQALAAKTDYGSTILTSGQGDTSQPNVATPGSTTTTTTTTTAAADDGGSANRGSAILASGTGKKKKLGQ